MKKWIVLAAGVVLQSVLGGVYAWSAFVPALTKEYGLTNGQAGLIFGITIAVFTLVMIPAGRLLAKFSPRVIAFSGAVLFGAGYFLASMSGGNYPAILTGIGILTGAGIGAGYVCPLTVGMKWFPDNKGLVTGVAVAGFGGGAIALSFLVQYLLNNAGWNVLQVFRLIGLGLGGVAVAASLFLSEPLQSISQKNGKGDQVGGIKKYALTRPFMLLCAGMFAGTFAGLLTVGNLKPILLDLGTDGNTATLGISIFAVGNASGRIIWGQIHDRLGVKPTVVLSLACLALSIIPFALDISEILLLVATGIAGAGFGACFVVYASSIVKYFGTEIFPSLYPICFLGYGLAGITGPAVGGWIADVTGSFTVGIFLSILLISIALIMNSMGLFSTQYAREKA